MPFQSWDDNTKGHCSWPGHQGFSALPDAPASLHSLWLMSAGTFGGLAQASSGEGSVVAQGPHVDKSRAAGSLQGEQ